MHLKLEYQEEYIKIVTGSSLTPARSLLVTEKGVWGDRREGRKEMNRAVC